MGGFKYDTTGGAICITMEVVVALWCDGGRSEWNVVNMRCKWLCVCGGLRCAAAAPPVSCLALLLSSHRGLSCKRSNPISH